MILYSYWRSTAAYRVRIALNIKKIKYSTKAIHLVKSGGEQLQDEYMLLNPQSLVPSLETDKGDVLTQSLAIIDYLESEYQDPLLYPNDTILKAKTKAMALSIACDIHPLNNLRVLKYLKGLEINQTDVDEWYHHWIHKGFTAIEKQLKSTCGLYCFGNDVTVADIFLVAQVYNANRFKVSLDDYPLIAKINNSCLSLKEFIDALPENQPDCDTNS